MQLARIFIAILLLCITIGVISHKQGCKHYENLPQHWKDHIEYRKNVIEQYKIEREKTGYRSADQVPRRNLATPQPLRVTFDYSRIQNLPSQESKDAITGALEISKKYIADLLKVEPLTSNIVVSDNAGPADLGQCVAKLDTQYSISNADKTTGIANSDLHIYVTWNNANDQSLAYAQACQYKNYRAIVGQINFNYKWFLDEYNPKSGASFEYNLETSLHELFHVLGFSSKEIDHFLDNAGNVIDNATKNQIKNTNYQWNGKTSIELKSTEVAKVAQEYFKCNTITGALMENEGDQGSKDDHWERSLMYNEFMTASGIQSDGVISKFTLAFFKDSNWYKEVNMDMAEDMQWGFEQGCDFYNQICNGVNQYPEFTKETTDTCSFHHFGIGKGTAETFTDGCKIVSIYKNLHCTDTANFKENPHNYTGEKFDIQSKCFEGTLIKSGLSSYALQQRCYNYKCLNNVVYIQVGEFNLKCTKDSEVLKAPLDYQGQLTCPKNLKSFCNFPVPCKNYCSNKGYCLRKGGISKCKCIDGYQGLDCSVQCPSAVCTQSADCKTGETYDAGTRTCNKCHDSCPDSCTGPSQSECTVCPSGKVLAGNSCVDSCPKGSQVVGQICEVCDTCLDGNKPNTGDSSILSNSIPLIIALIVILQTLIM